jgi:prephenate dehydrogenase
MKLGLVCPFWRDKCRSQAHGFCFSLDHWCYGVTAVVFDAQSARHSVILVACAGLLREMGQIEAWTFIWAPNRAATVSGSAITVRIFTNWHCVVLLPASSTCATCRLKPRRRTLKIARMHWQKVTLIGVGLLGGSLGLALKQGQLAATVCGFVRRQESVAECAQFGVADQVTLALAQAVENADLIILCTPLARMRSLTEQMLPSLKRGVIVTDVGSVKSSVVQDLESLVSQAGGHFVGSHPMAGSEKMGVSAAHADLFNDAICIVTPTPQSNRTAVNKVEAFWRSVGARALKLAPETHDELVSRSSHLPHVVAAELANYVLSPAHPKEQAWVCANGFRDTTRISSSSPEMWRDIALANRKHLARVIGVFVGDLQEFQHALQNGDAKMIEEFFVKAKQRRDAWCGQGHSPE